MCPCIVVETLGVKKILCDGEVDAGRCHLMNGLAASLVWLKLRLTRWDNLNMGPICVTLTRSLTRRGVIAVVQVTDRGLALRS